MNQLPRIDAKAILFDQGNTLLMDPFLPIMELRKHEFRRLCEEYGVVVSEQKISYEWLKSNRETNYPFIGHFFQEEPIVQRFLNSLHVNEDVVAFLGLELLKEYRTGLNDVILSDPRTEEVRETLQELKNRGKRLGVFSNDRIVGLGTVLNMMAIRSFFEYVETSESTGFEKPDPRVFEHILSYFCLEPHEVVYVGDDPVIDIFAAKGLGLKTILYRVDAQKYKEQWRDYGARSACEPDAMVSRLSELLAIL